MSDPTSDPTKVTNQPSLTTSTGRIWLVLGGLFAGIAGVMLFSLRSFSPPGLALWALVAVVLLYVGMIIVQLVTQRGRFRLGMLAGLMIVMAVVSLLSVVVIAASQVPAAR
ncbi:hypothetical protein [Subtercola frigoramans]|uniref:Membrane protein SirB2 n=1 Tax=Subtercola frigoramans TaxID=120298 RepID=A0ABS2L5B8_9MICO|nr:hypothetical protein [Subtercola frigoramans]MBM7471661.1 putative membrane protein SirB2 [Subtercola frigoramans]